MSDLPIFSYRQGDSFVHRIPSWVKILAIPLFNILVFTLDWRLSVCFIPVFFILALSIGFSIREIFRDLSPVFYYSLFLYLMNFTVLSCSLFAGIFSVDGGFPFSDFHSFFNKSFEILKVALIDSLKDFSTLKFSLRFCACVQSCSIMFRTSSSVQIRYGIESIEVFVRKFLPFGKEARFALSVSMLVIFIPTVFKIWSQLYRAWRARGGKSSISMLLVLIPQLFSVGLRTAFETTKSLMNRM